MIAGRRRLTIDYCQYRDARFPPKYRERTNLWTNASWFGPRPLCNRRCRRCDEKGKHMEMAQVAPRDGLGGHKVSVLYAVPPQLAEDILSFWELARQTIRTRGCKEAKVLDQLLPPQPGRRLVTKKLGKVFNPLVTRPATSN